MDTINYKVIEIIDIYTLLINYGSSNGATEGEDVRIIERGPEVIDPETKISLGTMDRIKDTLTITTVYENFSVCQKIESASTSILLEPLSHFNITKDIKTRLNVKEDDITNKSFSEKNKQIRPGDIVEVLKFTN